MLLREELDREQAAILENNNRGLGLQGHWEGKDNWYGGKIQQIVRMERSTDRTATVPWTLTLERMQMTRSHRFARFLGSRHLLQVKIVGKDRDLVRERKFLEQRFVLCGRIFVPFSTKDGKVYLMEIDMDYDARVPQLSQGDQYRISLEEFVAWHNPMGLNCDQVSSLHSCWAKLKNILLSQS